MASALANAFAQAGLDVVAIAARNREKSEAIARKAGIGDVVPFEEAGKSGGTVFLAVPDSAIAEAAKLFAGHRPGLLVHTSGSAGLEVLSPAKKNGWKTASFHPIQTVSLHSPRDVFRGVYISIVSDVDSSSEILSKITESIGANPLMVSAEDKQRLHIAAVILANYQVGLMKAAEDVLAAGGIKTVQIPRIFGPIMQSMVQNLIEIGPADALTGPIARGDVQTVTDHLQRLEKECPEETTRIYQLLGRLTLRTVGEKQSLDLETINQLKKALGDG